MKNKGRVFWITGLPGSGKSTIANLIIKDVNEKYGNTVLIHGDDIRNIYNLKSYEKKDRLKIAKSNTNLCRLITNQGVNVVFTTVGLFHELHTYNRKNIKNYTEIFIKSKMRDLMKKKNKRFYKYKTINVWGLDIKPEFPKKPDIILDNNFKFSVKNLGLILLKKLSKKIDFKI
jgi:adenylylsulfate kinase-like enzyme